MLLEIFHNYIKKIFSSHKYKKILHFNINMINLPLDELKLIAESGNIRNYENKSKKYLIKVLSESEPKIRISKKKLKEIRKDFIELRHKFCKKEIYKYGKAFYDIKNYRYLSASKMEEARENLNELKKV